MRKRSLLLKMIATLSVIMLLSSCVGESGKLIALSEFGQSWDSTIPKTSKGEGIIQVPDYRQLWASADFTSIRFWNPLENDMLLKYVVEYQGNSIWETKPIPAGTSLYFDAVKQFPAPGEYVLQVKVYAFGLDQVAFYNGVEQDAVLRIY